MQAIALSVYSKPDEGGAVHICNLYNVTTNQEAIRQFTRAMIDSIGNLQPSLDLYPDQMGPIVRNTGAGRELAMVRWGLPSSQQALMQATKKRADKLQAKGTPFDFGQLLRMEPDGPLRYRSFGRNCISPCLQCRACRSKQF